MTLEKCADPIDDGTQRQMQANEQAIEEMRRRERQRRQAVATALDEGTFDGKCCIRCGEEIPEERLAMVHMICTDCVALTEVKTKRNLK